MMKYLISTCISIWLFLFTKIWTSGKVPKGFSRDIIVKLFKKGDLMNCRNWRGINFIPVSSKLLASVILPRLRKELDATLREEQHGFRTERSCSDLIFVLRMLVEQSKEWIKKLYLLFIEFGKAFDSVD